MAAKQSKKGMVVRENDVSGKIATIRKQEVIADADVAELYGVETRAVNQAVKSVAIARGYVAPNGIELVCMPAFSQLDVDGELKTSIKFCVEKR